MNSHKVIVKYPPISRNYCRRANNSPFVRGFSLPLTHWINKTRLFLPTDIHTRPPVHPLMFLETSFYSRRFRDNALTFFYYSTGSTKRGFVFQRTPRLNQTTSCFITWILLAGNTELNHPGGNGLSNNFSFPFGSI